MDGTDEAHQARRLLERLPLVTYTLRREPPSDIVYLSPQIDEILGFRPADFADAGFWSSRIRAEDREPFKAALARLRDTGERMEVEYRVAGPAGEQYWVRDTGTVDGDLIHGYLVEITREKELEQALELERATLDAFFDETSIGLAITDEAGRYVRINDALARMNGGVRGEMIGNPLRRVAPQIADVVDPLRARVGLGERVDQAEVTVVAADGTPRRLVISYFPFDVDGVTHHGRIVLDVTEQRRAEAAERQYRGLVERLPLVSYVNELGPRHRATYVSPYIEELTGYPPQAFLDDPELGNGIVHPDDMPEIVEREETARRLGAVFEHEYRIVRADGGVRWVIDRMETICDETGEPRYEQGFLVDVTERHETAALLRAVWEGALDGFVIGDADGRYVDVNPAACLLLGRSREELLRLGVDDVFPRGTWDAYVASGESQREYTIVRPDGSTRTLESVAKRDVLPGLHLAVLRDVTDRRRLERELWRAQRLESVGRLAGGVAQDFNNLLTAIRGYAQLLQSRVDPDSVEGHHAREIDRAADRAAALTAQLLALGRRQMLKARPLGLNHLLEGIRDSLVELAGPRNEVVLDLDPGLRAVRVDSSLLAQAILQLVANAVDAMPDGGEILVRTRNAEVAGVDDLPDGGYVVLSVADEGIGIDETALEHVFEPFFTTKDVGEGSGLGLASAYGTVRQSGGTIRVESAPGRGATFSIYLPEATGAGFESARRGPGEALDSPERVSGLAASG